MAAPALEQLLAELLEPDSDVIRRATARLREAFADPQTPAHLALLLGAAARPQVRQLAAVLLRRRLLGRWRRLDPALRQRLPALLADALERESEHAVMVALAQLGALVLRRGGLSAWGPLGTWVQAAARDPRPARQEAALLVLSAALDAAPQALAPHAAPLAALCRGALAPGGPPGPTAYSLRALGGLAATVGGTQTELLRSLLPDILTALRRLIDADEERGAEALEVLDEFLEADPPAVIPHLRPLLDLCLQVGGDESRGDAVRVRALATVTFLAQKRPKALLRGGLLAPVLGGLLAPLCADPRPGHPDPEEEEEEEEEEGGGEGRGGPRPRHAAAQVLDALAVGLPPEKLLQQLVPLLEQVLGSPRAGARKGGLLALGALAGGCGEALRRRYLEPTLGVLRGGLGDPDPSVRGAAAFALRSLADCLQPEGAALAEAALPGALAALGGPRPPPAKAWYVLESLLECLGEGGGPWLPAVLEAILGALEPSGPPRNVELGLSALHSLASTAGDQLQPHAGPILGALSPLLRPGPPHTRPRCLQALGVLGALGRPVAGEGLVPALELGLRLLGEEEEPEGRRVTFVLAGAVAEALGEGMGPLLPRVVPVLLGALGRPPPPAPSEAPDSFLLFDDEEEEEGAEPMDDDASEEEELIEVEVGGAYAEEVAEACEALGEVAENSRAAFQPYLEPSLEAVMELLQFPQVGVRRAAYETLGSLCLAMGGAPAPPPPGGPSPPLERALGALLGGARGEPARGGARGALAALGRVLEGPGPAPPPALLAPIGRLLSDVIKGQVTCLRADDDDDDDDDDEEEQAEAVSELRELAGEGLVALGGALGGAFAPHFREVLPPLLAAMGPTRSVGERSWAAAMLAEMGGAMGEAVAPFLPRLGPALGGVATRDPHPEVRGNALFAIGRLAEAAGPALDAAWPGRAVLTRALMREGRGRVRDNACGALARHGGALPPGEVVPLVLGALPLGQDLGEEPPVFRYLLGLHRSDPAQLYQHAAQLPRACSDAVGSGRLPPELHSGLQALLRDVWGRCPTAFEEGVAALPRPDAARLRHALGLADAPGTC